MTLLDALRPGRSGLPAEPAVAGSADSRTSPSAVPPGAAVTLTEPGRGDENALFYWTVAARCWAS
ncbi:hypothetical protein [Streptomyces sp. NPDC059224]|uniref:hypothetical protein n=1 Tax=Streptomyces sp. NPDC059224 TaxID=3346775 RepID=UPI00368A7CAA